MNFGGGMPYGQGQDMSGNLIEYDGTVYDMAGGAYGHGMEQAEYPMFGTGGAGGAGGAAGTGTDGEYHQTGSLVVDGGDHFAVTATAFDHQEELLWMGNMGGHVTSYYSTGLQKYTSFQVHATQEMRQICPTESVVLCLSQSQLRGQLRRGLPAFTHTSANLVDMQCMLPRGDTAVLLGGHQSNMVSFDMARGKETQVVDIGANGCAILRHHARLVCCGDPTGRVTLRDPSSLRAQHSLDAHSASLNDLDVHNNLLVTCGFSHRGGKPAADRHLMIYDLRILRAISTIPVMLDPYLLKFIPSLSSRLAVVSSLGQLQIVETAQLNTPTLSLHSVETGGSMCTAMDISANSQAMAFGDGGGCLHLLTLANQECTFNNYSRETEFADPIEPLPAIPFTDRLTPLATVPMPITSEPLLSDWPAQWCSKVYRKPMKVDPVVLKTMRMVGTIGYAPNPGNRKRNQIPYKLGRPGQRAGAAEPPVGTQDDPFAVHVPKRYRKIDVKYSRNGLDEVDHLQYNRTSFSGLEASLPNSYCNAMLQVLYCLEPMREALISHLCQREFCLSCELSFLFHMLDTSQGVPCQASNFLRAFRTIPEATALGLILSDTLTNRQKINLPRLIQNWNRFILQQLDTECSAQAAAEDDGRAAAVTAAAAAAAAGAASTADASAGGGDGGEVAKATDAASSKPADAGDSATKAPADGSGAESDPSAAVPVVREPLAAAATDIESPVARILGALSRQTTRCIKCGASSEKESTILLCNLTYPQELDDREVSFGDTLASSLCLQQTVQAWCDPCGRYQPTEQVRHLLSLPHCLAVNCCTDNPKDLEFWRRQSGLLWSGVTEQEAGSAPPAPPSIKPCRYGAACTRPDCHFWHGGRPPAAAQTGPPPPAAAGDAKRPPPHWLPHVITCRLRPDGTVAITDGEDKEDNSTSDDRAVYDLTAVVCHVSDPKFPDKNNLVSVVRVGAGYHERAVGSAVSQWYIFNDLGVTPVSADEAVWLPLQWKVPIVLYYQSRRPSPVPAGQLRRAPLTAATLLPVASVAARPAQTGQFTPLEPDEMPGKGDLVAMDAEFVTLNQEEAEIRSDGTKSMLKPSHMSVARISVVRGQGPREGLPFIDDYISTQEQVVDYLTKFSGIKPGDLDANFTSKHLTTLKSTYLKLRFLVDHGVKFVGHGLKNDFRVINLTVPPDQVIDTVHLFYRTHQRMVSLRFLAWHFLKLRIQSETHDSVEDARTALALYRCYQKLQAQGGQALNDAIQQMYEAGRQAGWKVPGASGD